MPPPLNALLVEDSESDAQLICYNLKKAGFELTWERVETAPAMQAALEKHAWDIVISDYNMPNFSAPAALALLQRTHPEIPFIVASGTITEETALGLMRSGAADYLMKDRLARLGALVNRELNIARVQRERTEARNALLESERRFQILFEQSPYGVVIIDCETTLPLEFNRAAHQQLGYTREEFARLRISDYELAESPEEVETHSLKIRTDLWDSFETRHRSKQGELRFVQVYVQLIELSGKKVFYSIYRDITDLKRVETALRLSEQKFSTAFQVSPDTIIISRLVDGLYLDVNQGFTAMTGYRAAEVIGKTPLDINIWANPQDRSRLVEGLLETGEVKNLEAPFRIKDGSIKVCLMSARIIEVEGEKCLLSVTHDINERKQAEDALRASESMLSLIINTSRDAIGVSKAGTHIMSNPAYLSMFGYDNQSELVNKSILNQIAPEQRPQIMRNIQNRATGGPVSDRYETVGLRRDGSEFDMEVTVSTYRLNEEIYTLVILRDITGRKQADQKINQQLEELRRWDSITRGREKRIMELKSEVNQLLGEAGQPLRYASVGGGERV